MIQESATGLSPSSITGTFSEPCGAIAAFSVKRHGIDSAPSPLCASAIRVRQQYGLNGRVSSVPTSSNSFSAIASLHHRRGLPEQQLALFLGADRGLAEIRIDFLGFGIGAQRR